MPDGDRDLRGPGIGENEGACAGSAARLGVGVGIGGERYLVGRDDKGVEPCGGAFSDREEGVRRGVVDAVGQFKFPPPTGSRSGFSAVILGTDGSSMVLSSLLQPETARSAVVHKRQKPENFFMCERFEVNTKRLR